MEVKIKNEVWDFYTAGYARYSAERLQLKRRVRVYVAFEAAFFCAAVVLAVLFVVWQSYVALPVAAGMSLVAYLVVRRLDVRNDRRIEHLERQCAVYSHELSGLNGDFSVFDSGDRYADMAHPFTFDLDIFGRDSLFNRLDRTVTVRGSDILADSLRMLPAEVQQVEARRQAVDELSRLEAFRTEFLVRGAGRLSAGGGKSVKIDTTAIADVVHEVAAMRFPRFFMGRAAVMVATAALAAFYVLVLLALFSYLPGFIPFDFGLLLLCIVLSVTARPLQKAYKAVGKLRGQMSCLAGLVSHIHAGRFNSAELNRLYSTLFNEKADAQRAFNELSEISSALDRRGNWLALIVLDMVLLNDLFIVRRFLRWQRDYMGNIETWIDAVGLFDAYLSKAVFRFNNPEAAFARVEDGNGVVFRAEGLCHPFLGNKAVPNDFEIVNRNYYIVTGANMAGKSTFLRAVGMNYLLAVNGLPVFAKSLEVSLFNMFSSMRTTDDVSRGISYFNAELLRLGSLIDSCKNARCTLIILDEILKGTNSLDKLNGSRLFLEKISALPVTGIIATHDLELSKMEDLHPGRFHNFCFEIQLADDVSYTYKVTPGVARNQNATYLLGKMLENV